MGNLFILIIIGVCILLFWNLYRLRQRTKVLSDYVRLDLRLYFSRQSKESVSLHSSDPLYGSLLMRLQDMDVSVAEVLITQVRFLDPNYQVLHFSTLPIPHERKGNEIMRSISFSCSDPHCIDGESASVLILGSVILEDGSVRKFISRQRALLQRENLTDLSGGASMEEVEPNI